LILREIPKKTASVLMTHCQKFLMERAEIAAEALRAAHILIVAAVII
jgi:hypothetical protein